MPLCYHFAGLDGSGLMLNLSAMHKLLTQLSNHRTMSEVPELIISALLKIMAQSIFGIFVPIYLYRLGNPLWLIALYFAVLSFARIASAILAAPLIARFGPRAVMVGSTFMLVLHLLSLIALSQAHFSILIPAILFGLYMGAYFVAYNDDFSLSIDARRSTRSIGWYLITGRLVMILGPIAGGALATLGGFQLSLYAGIFVLIASVIVLMLPTSKPPETIRFTWRDLRQVIEPRDIIADTGNTIDTAANNYLWPLVAAVVIFKGSTYLGFGALSSLGAVTAVVVTPLLRQLIDTGGAGLVYRLGVITSVAIHALRAIVSTIPLAAVLIAVKDPAEVALTLGFSKGYYERADDYADHRLAYLAVTEAVPQLLCGVLWLSFAVILALLPNQLGLAIALLLSAAVTMLMLVQNFPDLEKR